MRDFLNLVFSLLLLVSVNVSAQESTDPPYRILFPQDGLRTWVDTILVTGETDTSGRAQVNGIEAPVDSMGRFYHPVAINTGLNSLVTVVESNGSQYVDTLTVIGMRHDRLDADSNFINLNIPDSLSIEFISPRSGRIRNSPVSMRGYTHPEATLLMNAETLTVYASGAFTSLLELSPGINQWVFTAILGTETVSDTLSLVWNQRPEWISQRRLEINVESMLPRTERWAMSGDVIRLGFQGTPGKHAMARVSGFDQPIILTEIDTGSYYAEWQIPPEDASGTVTVRYSLGSGLLKARARNQAPLKILDQPLGGRTTHPDSRMYDFAYDSNILMPLPDSISVQVIGMENNMYRIRLADTKSGYILKSRVELDPKARIGLPIMVGSMYAQDDSSDWHRFNLFIGDRRVPYEIKEYGNPLRLELRLYGAKQSWEWTTYPEDDSDIAFMERAQIQDDVWQMTFYPRGEVIWGWYANYVGDHMEIGIRKTPEINASNPFANIRITVDPGHGGWQRGAVGLTGYAEADANLRYSRMLTEKLRAAGAHVTLTRNIDKQLDLSERARIAREDSAHIFVWAHNNAPGSGRDLLEARGASTYYTWPSSKKLSDTLYPHMHTMGIATSGKVVRYYYYMTRQTEYLVYLIEGAFMTNPDEEMFLRSDEGLDRLATAAFQGLRDFLMTQVNTGSD